MELTYTGVRPTVTVTGRVDREKTTEVSGTVRGLVAVGVEELVVDLTRARGGAALLSVLARARADLVERGGRLRVLATDTDVA